MTQDNPKLPTDLTPPYQNGTDKAHTILKAAMAGVPLVGGPANELMGLIFAGPYQKRLQKWRDDVASLLNYLVNKKKFSIEDLQENEIFISAVANASQIAMRNHEEEKREALRNALVNCVVLETIDESLINQFLNYIDTLTVWHIRILKTFYSLQSKQESGRYRSTPSSPAQVLEEFLPELRGKRDIYDPFWRDLYSRGLVSIEGLHITMSTRGAYTNRTTPIGDQFIEFISSPR